MKTIKKAVVKLVHWFTLEAKLYHWKVTLTLLAAVAVSLGFYNMVEAKNTEQIHRLECLRAAGREDLRTVLFAFARLPPEFGTGPAIVAYEDSRKLIVDTVLQPIHVEHCPES